jgi:hypothetical protein
MSLLLFHLVKNKRMKGRIKKKSYDSICKFQIEWAICMPWAKGLVFKGGFKNVVKCRMCSLIENKEKIIGCKWDMLPKQQGHRIVAKDMPKLGVKKGGEYITYDYAHMNDM